MYSAINLLNNRTLHTRFTEARDHDRQMLLFEMARRVGTSGAMLLEEYRENPDFRRNIDDETERLFVQYKLNGGQDNTW